MNLLSEHEIQAAVDIIKSSGPPKVRLIQNPNGSCDVQIYKCNAWQTVIYDTTKAIAESILKKASNNLIQG